MVVNHCFEHYFTMCCYESTREVFGVLKLLRLSLFFELFHNGYQMLVDI